MKSFLSGGHVFKLNWIEVRSLGSAIFKSALLAETGDKQIDRLVLISFTQDIYYK